MSINQFYIFFKSAIIQLAGFVLIFNLYQVKSFGQLKQFFNLLPDLKTANGQSQFYNLALDSNYIYLVGDGVSSEDSNGTNKLIEVRTTVLDYAGNILRSSVLENTCKNGDYLYTASSSRLIKLSDSIWIHPRLQYWDRKSIYAQSYITSLNLYKGSIVNCNMPARPREGDFGFDCTSDCIYRGDNLLFIYRSYDDPKNPKHYIADFDQNLGIRRVIPIPDIRSGKDYFVRFNWIDSKDGNIFELVGEESYLNPKKNYHNYTWDLYLRIDSSGNILKLKRHSFPEFGKDWHLSFAFADGFKYFRNADGSFTMLGCLAPVDKSRQSPCIPYIIRYSPELDSVIWKVRFHEQGGKVHDTLSDFVGSLIGLSDGSGFMACGSVLDYNFPKASYAYLFKASSSGDSVWMRKYLPLGWTNDRARWLDFFQLQESPYGGIVACGRVSDDSTSAIRAWVIHLDSLGCLVPGCDKLVSNEDVQSGSEAAFVLYPNPAVGDYVYLLSRISTNEPLRMQMLDMKGMVILDRLLKPQVGVQYLLELPPDLIHGIYTFHVSDSSGRSWLSQRFVRH
jgi:hypothetical protein